MWPLCCCLQRKSGLKYKKLCHRTVLKILSSSCSKLLMLKVVIENMNKGFGTSGQCKKKIAKKYPLAFLQISEKHNTKVCPQTLLSPCSGLGHDSKAKKMLTIIDIGFSVRRQWKNRFTSILTSPLHPFMTSSLKH